MVGVVLMAAGTLRVGAVAPTPDETLYVVLE